ncbi:hypothetical protein Purlil1_12887 [Purpureocillium lilacinum]|uniref:Endonuclease/exonuclease/phosphatase domain-containing protein n=1 Tax=Purpureocillium lilacinum TaxID=33203 RepID=A0ABR0BFN1_PURLI|nr:hypothetical protein Purlil1_12887 [Purpureocillium lilacinum]
MRHSAPPGAMDRILGRPMSYQTHPAYDTFSPVDSWEANNTRPRVRRLGVMVDQRRPVATRDIIRLTSTIVLSSMYTFNRPPDRCLVAGDFNAKHHSWQSTRMEGRGEAFVEWATTNGLNLLNQPVVLSNSRDSTIDLAFSDIALAHAVVEDQLAASSESEAAGFPTSSHISTLLGNQSVISNARDLASDVSRFSGMVAQNETRRDALDA